jgi:hypothetical protein
MQLYEFLQHGFIALLGAYIATSNMLAFGIMDGLARLGFQAPAPYEITLVPDEERATFPQISTNLARILLDNLEYQEAAVISATEPRTETAPAAVEDALVNILCKYHADGGTLTTTGSGVFIDTKGVILTNAHVAQFLLLSEAPEDAECIVRQGSPATPRYRAELLYLSPLWVGANAQEIDAQTPTGTGEYDYALLFVTEAVEGDLPKEFPALRFDTSSRQPGELEDLRSAGYPAASFAAHGASAQLRPVVDETTLVRRFTFGSGSPDLISMSGSSVGEHGSSGGPVLDGDNTVIGLIVTEGNPERDGARSLRALTLSYVDAAIKEEAGFGLDAMLKGDIKKRAAIFTNALAPVLTELLAGALE